MTQVAVLVGSLRQDSINKKLARAIEKNVGEDIEFIYVDVNLPLFNEELEATPPQAVLKAREIVAQADAVLMVTPEYNRSFPGVLKNAIDWLSRPYGQGVIFGKKVGITGASGGPIGTAAAQNHLRSVVGHLNMHLMGQPELYATITDQSFDDKGEVIATDGITTYAEAFAQFIR